jgi:hypothetical protein
MKIFTTALFVLLLVTLFKSYKTEKVLYSSGQYQSTGTVNSQNRLIPGLLPLPEPGVVTQIAASQDTNHVLILMNNSTVYTFGTNTVNLNSFN